MGQADVLRKAMGKKIVSLLAEQKEKFTDGCVKNGINKELAEKILPKSVNCQSIKLWNFSINIMRR
jgi:DNA polymerase III alpha subunit